jgi:hypothetical protein
MKSCKSRELSGNLNMDIGPPRCGGLLWAKYVPIEVSGAPRPARRYSGGVKTSGFSSGIVDLFLALAVSACTFWQPAAAQVKEKPKSKASAPSKVEQQPAAQYQRDARYPAHWWTPVAKKEAKDWEILPQEAGPGEVILSKRHELGLLSNFAPTPFEFHGKHYASLEGFWQMMKYPEGPDDPRAKFPGLDWKYTRDEVAQLTSFDAKKAGDLASQNMQKMGIDWVSFEGKHFPYKPKEPGEHYRLIVEATREKVRQNRKVERVLLSTGDLVLKPDHHQPPDAPAAWRYYEILTGIRGELQKHPPN